MLVQMARRSRRAKSPRLTAPSAMQATWGTSTRWSDWWRRGERRGRDRSPGKLFGPPKRWPTPRVNSPPPWSAAPCAEQLDSLLTFLRRHELLPKPDDPLRPRLLRGRAAVLDALTSLAAAYARFDPIAVEFDAVAAVIRRWIDAHTFAPRTGEGGVHLVDAESARFGDFEGVQLAGLVDGEWPDAPRRNIFYPPALLRELGWPTESRPARRSPGIVQRLAAIAILTPGGFDVHARE